MPKLSIIIVTHNSQALIAACLEAVYREITKWRPEVVVVDNGSIDGTVAEIKKHFPQVKLITQANLGFAAGVNAAVKKSTGEFLWLLNPDMIITPYAAERLMEFLLEHKKVALVGAQLIGLDRRPQASFGNFPGYLTELIQSVGLHYILPGRYLPYAPWRKKYFKVGPVSWVSGGGMMLKRLMFNRLRGFDRKFFMYLEDVDLCWRARLLGYGVYYLSGAKIIHIHQASWQGNRVGAAAAEEASLLYYFKKQGRSVVVLKILLSIKKVLRRLKK